MSNPADAYPNYFKNFCTCLFSVFSMSTAHLDRISMNLDYVHKICYSSYMSSMD